MTKTLSNNAIEQVKADHRWIKQQRRGVRAARPRFFSDRQPLIEGFLDDDLDAAADSILGTTTATMSVLRGDALSDPVEIVNRSVDLSLEAGTYVIAAWINGSWRIVWADCGPTDTSASSLSIAGGGGGTTSGGGTYGGGGGGYGSGGYGGS